MKIYATDQFTFPLPAGHRFPVEKYRLLRERLLASGIVSPAQVAIAPAATDEELQVAHDPEYLRRFREGELTEREIRKLGLPWSLELVERSRRSVGATLAACRDALETGLGVSLAGGTHHAMPNACQGYCVYNDVGVAVHLLQREGRIDRALVIDLDVHQGDGTAVIFREDSRVFTFSMHGGKNFPFRKEPGDLDIELADGTGDERYLRELQIAMEIISDQPRPELAIYLAGADPFLGDRLGRLSLSKEGLAQRDGLVFQWCYSRRIPLAITMAGGYAEPIEDTAEIHAQTVALALANFADTD